MPPSPALRYSPGRERRGDNHKRGRSLEGGLLFKEKDDDLALFNEMQHRERENFLLQSVDDFNDTFSSKLRYFSDTKLGISIPARGESSELLNAEGEKNDYDWLLTPPDTPLFPSLDDEPPPVDVASRGRPRSQPITISRSSTMEKSHRSSRGSASPNRLSPSPRSGSSTFQSRGRPSPSPHSSQNASQRPATPSRRPSPPPGKPSTPSPRSSTPTSRIISPGSAARGSSPVRMSRGNSASPKIRSWQSNIPGFSSEAPPNLRTSLADRPASYVRGSSPASRNGRDKFGRQSMSPTASRSASSSHSQERDRISSHSKCSVASSGDDDADSLQSVHVGSLDRIASKRIGPFPNNRAPALNKKSGRIISPASAPKRYFDSALQVDRRKSPQNMFRPLLSSVPSSTFFVGKASSAHRSLMPRNSSVTTSSNTSSDQVIIVAPDTEESDHQQEDMENESGKVTYPDVHEEVFAFDKGDAFRADLGHDRENGMHQILLDEFDRDAEAVHEAADSEEITHQDTDMEISSASNTVLVGTDFAEVDSLENTKICSKCGSRYHAIETEEKYVNLCPDCIKYDNVVAAATLETTIIFPDSSSMISEAEKRLDDEAERRADAPESFSSAPMIEAGDSCLEERVKQSPSVVGKVEQRISQHERGQSLIAQSLPDQDTKGLQLLHSDDHSSLKPGISEGAGISLLLKRSSSSKGPVVQGRTFSASTMTYDDLSYTRNSINSSRSSIGYGNTSASSSVDFGPARQVETRVQRQLSGKKCDSENCRYDQNTRLRHTRSSSSASLNDAHQALGLTASSPEENINDFGSNTEYNGVDEACISSDAVSVGIAVPNEYSSGGNESSRAADSSTSYLCHDDDIQSEEKAVMSNYDNLSSNENKQDLANNIRSACDIEKSDIPPDILVEAEHNMQNSSLDGLDGDKVPSHGHTNGLEMDDASTNSKSTTVEFQDSSTPMHPEELAVSMFEHNLSDHNHVIEESTVMVECQGGSKARSLTLEEATDAILFCSSIVHDLAHRAATIAIEKESSIPLETSRPTLTILGKSTADRKDQHGRTTGKRASKSLKVRQRRVETNVKSPSSKAENDENVDETMVRNVGLPKEMDSMKPPKLESKCNCTIM